MNIVGATKNCGALFYALIQYFMPKNKSVLSNPILISYRTIQKSIANTETDAIVKSNGTMMYF